MRSGSIKPDEPLISLNCRPEAIAANHSFRIVSPQLGAPDIVVRSAEIARVPIRVLSDLDRDRARLFDAASEYNDPSSFVGMGEPAILIGNLGFAGSDVYRAGYRIRLEFLLATRVHEHRGAIVL